MMRKKLNPRSEKKWMMVLDFAIIAITCVLLSFLLVKQGTVSIKSFIAAAGIYGVMVFVFMHALDEYKIYVSSMYEKGVIFFLSSVYSYVIIAMVDIIVLGNLRMAAVHLAYMAGVFAALVAENYMAKLILKNPAFFERPKLLILETDEHNVQRMKRMKYGSLQYYDSWYEILNTSDMRIDKIYEKLEQFDAVCILDRVNDTVYNAVVKAATEFDMDLYIAPKLTDIGRNYSELTQLDDVVTMYIPRYSLGSMNTFFKRATDIVIASIGLVIAAIPMALIALAIKLTSTGPVFYKQVRLTKGKREFEIYKFRTMVPDAEKMSGPVLAAKNDNRITPVGKILRACRLDELPQIINILKGDMSVVGPRPERPFFVEQFEREIESYKYRFAVKAGLTGLSHVYGRYSTYIYDRTCFDLIYITDYSYFLDLKIILLTTKILFLKSAAEGEDEFKRAGAKSKSETKEVDAR